VRAGILTAAEGGSSVRESLGTGSIAGLVRMPRLLAVITEQSPTARPLTRQLRTTRAAWRYNHVPTASTTTFFIGKKACFEANSQHNHQHYQS